jgi:hypothetical protein
VYSYGGDVIKFAGDAIFVIWEIQSDNDSEAVTKALTCAMEININCNHCEVHSSSLSTNPTKSHDSVNNPKEEVIYLNVHSGISKSNLVEVDVSDEGRREYFLVGAAVSLASKCLELASPGTVVVSSECARLVGKVALRTSANYNQVAIDENFIRYEFAEITDLNFSSCSIESLKFLVESPDICRIFFNVNPTVFSGNANIFEYIHEALRPSAESGEGNSM